MGDRVLVHVDGRELELSNLDKVLFPQVGFTKGEVIDYYTRIAPTILPHLRDRPLTRIRYPDGAQAQSFFEKNAPVSTPDWVRQENLPAPGSASGRDNLDYVVADDRPTLVWLANLAALELHVPQWKVDRPNGRRRARPADPDLLVVDLDPGAPAGLEECCGVALLMREYLAADGLTAYPKTSGKKGMQLMCAVSGTQSSEVVSRYARRVAEKLEKIEPRLITSKMARNLRPGKVFIDWSQNSQAKTTVAPYSLRAQPTPTVSTPLTWEEVEAGGITAAEFGPEAVLARIEEYGDLMSALCETGAAVPRDDRRSHDR